MDLNDMDSGRYGEWRADGSPLALEGMLPPAGWDRTVAVRTRGVEPTLACCRAR